MKKLNCWEVKKCGNKANNTIFEEAGTCPASSEFCTQGVNGGENGGRACWAIAGTHCGGEIQGCYASKISDCIKCNFYKQVQEEEGEDFVSGFELIERLMYKDQFPR